MPTYFRQETPMFDTTTALYLAALVLLAVVLLHPSEAPAARLERLLGVVARIVRAWRTRK